MKKPFKIVFPFAIMLMLPLTASADMIWPSLYVAQGMRSWLVILAGLIIEFLVVKLFTKQSWPKSLLISVVINGISTIVGVALIPITGLLGELIMIPADLIFDINTFHTSHWAMAYIMVVVCNVFVEGIAIKLIFKMNFTKNYLWLYIANILSVAICILSFGFMPNW